MVWIGQESPCVTRPIINMHQLRTYMWSVHVIVIICIYGFHERNHLRFTGRSLKFSLLQNNKCDSQLVLTVNLSLCCHVEASATRQQKKSKHSPMQLSSFVSAFVKAHSLQAVIHSRRLAFITDYLISKLYS